MLGVWSSHIYNRSLDGSTIHENMENMVVFRSVSWYHLDLIVKAIYSDTKPCEAGGASKWEKNLRRGKICPLYNYDPEFECKGRVDSASAGHRSSQTEASDAVCYIYKYMYGCILYREFSCCVLLLDQIRTTFSHLIVLG